MEFTRASFDSQVQQLCNQRLRPFKSGGIAGGKKRTAGEDSQLSRQRE
jgi:hypothetical protein